jgi:two-component system phosphate regulon sensor histidine kinase PhoR
VRSPEMANDYATRILSETERLGHLVNQVLDLAALERGVAALNAQVGDLGETAESAVALLGAKAESAGVALTVQVDEGVPEFAFDPQLVRPMILNLVDNAIKYSGKSEHKEVRVRVSREGERVVLSVADRGVGIDPKARKGVFEPFQRAGDEMTRDAPGIGIGLALVKRYAEAHNARVHLVSEPGVGTTVSVRFKL